MKVDLHIHVDEGISTRDLYIHSKKLALDAVGCIAHNSLDLPLTYSKILSRKYELLAFPGVEITTDFGDVILFNVEDKPKGNSLNEVLDFARENKATLICSHPFFPPGLGKKAFRIENAAIETLNGASRYFFWTNLVASILAKRFNKASVWASDAHIPSQIGLCWIKIPRSDQHEGLSTDLLKRVYDRGVSRSFGFPFDLLPMIRLELAGHKHALRTT
ncbi:MAG: PHP domain-containing protein [Candidatus Thorarchaeota archaeon]